MIAEAYIRKGESSYPQAIEWINKLRTRAGYAEGEDRSKHVDGGQSYKNNSYCTGKGGGYSAEGAVYWEINTCCTFNTFITWSVISSHFW